MLRITEILETRQILRLRLDGRLVQQSFEELAELCRKHSAKVENSVLIDMAGVTFTNEETAERLLALRGERLRIINCSPFVEMLLNSKENNFARDAAALSKHANRQRRDGNG